MSMGLLNKIFCWSQRQVANNLYHSTISAITPARPRTVVYHQTIGIIFLQQKQTFALKRKDYVFPDLKEDDLEENFVRGSGPGGQSVNKTSNCVVLKHVPTGIVVKCHETRSLHDNRKRARTRMQEKIDYHLKGNDSFLALQESEAIRDKSEKKQKARNRLAMKRAFKEKEGLD